jgi:RNA polymerase sigma factor (sigma-70 family)
MRPRKQLTEKFSSFLLIESMAQQRWVRSAALCRHLNQWQLRLGESPGDEKFWVTYWYQLWQKATPCRAGDHLCAYLQEACFWAVKSLADVLQSSQFSLADLFQTAIAQYDKVLRHFNPTYQPSLATYARYKFKHLTIDRLRQQKEADICSPWSLLRKLSGKQVREALAEAGFDPTDIGQRQQLWHLYKTLWAAQRIDQSRRLTQPDAALLEQLAQAYSHIQSQQAGIPMDPMPGRQVERSLLELAQAARTYLYPKANSLNVSLGDEGDTESQDLLPDPAHNLAWEHLVQQEVIAQRSHQQQQLQAMLVQSLADLSEADRDLLQRYYGHNTTQQAIAQALGLKQYQIARQLSRIRRCLLQQLMAWSTAVLHISPDATVIAHMDEALKVWLQTYAQSEGVL